MPYVTDSEVSDESLTCSVSESLSPVMVFRMCLGSPLPTSKTFSSPCDLTVFSVQKIHKSNENSNIKQMYVNIDAYLMCLARYCVYY